MTTSKSLPARPSLESLRKQAKKLARDLAAGNTDAITRARTQMPDAKPPLTQREAQLVLAREYGYAGWQDLTAEVHKRLGKGLEWAASQAHRIIHDNDIEGLKQLLVEYPALLSWRGGRGEDEGQGGLLGMATSSFGDSFDPNREQFFTRAACAELLIDSGAIVVPSVCDNLIRDRAKGLLQLFQRKGLLPRTLRFLAALGDIEGVRAYFDAGNTDLVAVNEAFMCACRLRHEALASLLLDQSIVLDREFGKRIDGGPGRSEFIQYLMEDTLEFTNANPDGPWQAFLMNQVVRAIHDNALDTFGDLLQRESWLLGDSHVGFQVGLIQRATLRDRGAFISTLIDLNPALMRRRPPLESQTIEFALTYVKPHLIPLLTRIWPIPDDLPHAAGMGDIAGVKRWFDESGKPALGELTHHFPANSEHTRMNLQWGAPSMQQVLDTAFAWAVLNRHFAVADFLLEHGADINTRWGSHEPASILHELVFHENYESMQFLIDRGIDMTIVDYRWDATAEGWARYAANNEKLAQWLATAARHREEGPR
jgi:hypothetical protein